MPDRIPLNAVICAGSCLQHMLAALRNRLKTARMRTDKTFD
ncbi:hypothetical protein [Xanthomonas arboricola]|nr:hypothetical protein [Xanthomonas arboricola]